MTSKEQNVTAPRQAIYSSDIKQQSVFIAALSVGAVAVVISRWFALSGAAYIVVGLGIPVLCMLGYWFANHKGEFFDSTRSQVADNIYFLGFLFFLISLAGTLILFAGAEGAIRERIIVEGFGIALVTTILGLALRILVLQQASSVEDARERAERDLLATIVQLRSQITAGSEALRQAQEVAIGGLTETSKLLVQKVAATAEEMDQKVQGAATNMAERMSQIAIPADALSRALQPLVEGIGRAVGELEQSTRGQADAGRELAKSVRSLAKPLNEASIAVGALNQSVAAAQPNVGAVAEAVAQAAGKSSEMAAATEATRQSMKALEAAVSDLSARVGSMRTVDHLEKAVLGLKAIQEHVDELQKATAGLMPEVQRNLAELPTLVGGLGTAASELRKASEAARGLAAGLERTQSPEMLREAAEAAGRMIKELREAQAAWEESKARGRSPRLSEGAQVGADAETSRRRSWLGRLFGRG